MEAVKLQWIQRTIQSAKAMGFQITIVDSDGMAHGKIDPPKRTRSKCAFEFGAVKKHIDKYVPRDIAIGDIYHVPGAEFGVARVRSTLSSTLSKKYGKDAHVTSLNRADDYVEVMRTA